MKYFNEIHFLMKCFFKVTVEQDNTISALQQRNKKLNTELDTWKARYEILNKKSATDLVNSKKEQDKVIQGFKQEIEEFKNRIDDKESEINKTKIDLEDQKQLNTQSPSAEVKGMVEKLKGQLVLKEEQQKVLNQALNSLKSDMVSIAKSNLTSLNDESGYEKKIQSIIEKISGEYQDKLYTVEEDLAKCKKELKSRIHANEELSLELEHAKSQLSN